MRVNVGIQTIVYIFKARCSIVEDFVTLAKFQLKALEMMSKVQILFFENK